MEHIDQLDPKSAIFVAALMRGSKLAIAARMAGISRYWAYKLLEDPKVKNALQIEKRRLIEESQKIVLEKSKPVDLHKKFVDATESFVKKLNDEIEANRKPPQIDPNFIEKYYAVSIQELSKILGCSHNALTTSAKKGYLPEPVIIGKRKKYPISELAKIFPGAFDRKMQE